MLGQHLVPGALEQERVELGLDRFAALNVALPVLRVEAILKLQERGAVLRASGLREQFSGQPFQRRPDGVDGADLGISEIVTMGPRFGSTVMRRSDFNWRNASRTTVRETP